MAGSNNKLTLTSEDGDINLFGQLSVAGTTSLNTESQSDAANNIFANNAGNAFGTLELNSDSYDGGTITIVSANTLTFGNSTIASASLTATADAGSILTVERDQHGRRRRRRFHHHRVGRRPDRHRERDGRDFHPDLQRGCDRGNRL